MVFLFFTKFGFQSASNFEPKVLLFDMSCLLCALFWPALICSFGTFATDRIESVGDIAYDSNWYAYPTEVRKHVMLIIGRSQEPVYFMGYGVVRATLEVFGKVDSCIPDFSHIFTSSYVCLIFSFLFSSSDHLAHIIWCSVHSPVWANKPASIRECCTSLLNRMLPASLFNNSHPKGL